MPAKLAPNARRALVIGGSGAIGSAVVRALVGQKVPTVFTYHRSADKAKALAAELGASAVQLDCGQVAQLESTLATIAKTGMPDVVIHCAAISAPIGLTELTWETFRRTTAINAESVLWLARWLAQSSSGAADLVVTGALDRGQSLPLPVHYAATQGMLSAMIMALGHELGERGILVNQVALGVMEEGLSRDLPAGTQADFEKFSALRRRGKAEEAAAVICWLALENTYIQGKVIPINGGI